MTQREQEATMRVIFHLSFLTIWGREAFLPHQCLQKELIHHKENKRKILKSNVFEKSQESSDVYARVSKKNSGVLSVKNNGIDVLKYTNFSLFIRQ